MTGVFSLSSTVGRRSSLFYLPHPEIKDFDPPSRGGYKNKYLFQKEHGLNINPDIPILSMITRLTETKGIDLVTNIIDELLSENIQFVILGSGEKKYEDFFSDLTKKYPNMKAFIKFDRAMSKKIYASSDIFLMPSKSEPCGLAQLIACSYGTIPIVRSVGGLADTIIPYGKSEKANGFSFDNFSKFFIYIINR